MKCKCDQHIEYCDICFPPEKRRHIVKPQNGKPLTGDEIMSFALQHDLDATWSKQLFEFVRSIERAHKIGE